MVKNLIRIRDVIKKKQTTHTLESASVYSDECELSDSQLECVSGGMSFETFDLWRSEYLNKLERKK